MTRILVISDLHGSLSAYEKVPELYEKEHCDQIIILGDLSSYGYINERIIAMIRQFPIQPIVVKGNCDKDLDEIDEIDYRGECYIKKEFNKIFFFTHGDRYNYSYLPPILEEGDVLVYGHTHVGGLGKNKNIIIANCGSLGYPRNGAEASYLVISDGKIALKSVETGEIIQNTTF